MTRSRIRRPSRDRKSALSPAMTRALAAIRADAGGWSADGEWYPDRTDPYAVHAAQVDRAALLSGRPW
jgi:hypothetical protein